MDLLEREMGYKEELFDFIQQFLRTILLKRTPKLNMTYTRRRITTLPIIRPSSIPFILIIPLISTKCSPTIDSTDTIR